MNAPSLRSTQGVSDDVDESQPSIRPRGYIVRAFECHDPHAGASRHALGAARYVDFRRGPRAVERRTEAGQERLTLYTPDPKMSAHHARLTLQSGSWLLEDIGSTNGSFVNGARVARASVPNGATLELGTSQFLFQSYAVEPDQQKDKALLGCFPLIDTLNPLLERALQRLWRVAASHLPVLLLGESGTGKEILAREVHRCSQRSGPLVAVNCGAIPEALMEAHLFGHVRGAFTGAANTELGFVRLSDHGTLFLDEIGDLPTSSQAALLRVLQEGEVIPVGGTRPTRVNVRIVAATHQDLDRKVANGTFRRDLYARLAGFIHLQPTLTQRREDLGLFIASLIAKHSGTAKPVALSSDAARALFAYDFPLNIRELEHCLSAALVLADTTLIGRTHLPDRIKTLRPAAPDAELGLSPARAATEPSTLQGALSAEDAALRAVLLSELAETAGNVSEVARRMGKARQQVQRWMRRFQLDGVQFKA